ncbi:MAG: DEAD/DEAH box helicase, partial [Deltaproteobacteria bacterium]|nr:DEAD/DEAH box helicase [Deltaproteobacteria bacterium]
MITAFHAKYFAYELSRTGGSGVARLGRALFDACVDLNPHQIEAALFALRSPVSKGVLLADEVGLGKTIEAGLVLCQYWAEHRRRLIVICPASIRKQWALELMEKFNLPSTIIDAKSFKQIQSAGNPNPFEADDVVITSIHFASRHAGDIRAVPWHLAVIDEAHKLRNAYRQSNKMGQNIRWALEDQQKILLTATPLQNSLLELYGLSTILDERIFGDLSSFRTQYVNAGADFDDLRDRLHSFCTRTLRRQVVEFIQYTERRLVTRYFRPTEQEHKLYKAISDYLQREGTYAFPDQQRHLTILIVRKVLASSSMALAGTLKTIHNRLISIRENLPVSDDLTKKFLDDEEIDDELLDELLNDDLKEDELKEKKTEADKQVKIDHKKLSAEIDELDRYIQMAHGIGVDTKIHILLDALKIGFNKMMKIGAAQKAVIFTESRRTQQYMKNFLEANGYAGQVITFNGTNTDADSTRIYQDWIETNRKTGRIAGSRPVDIRIAIIEYFRDYSRIMIATEAASEGINLQFCSLVVNFDLPWNPQRIEQRIGRCHRYGQKHDVVVINFLNKRNKADKRVYELLNEKFNLFSGVFGASDDVLGAIESGVDFERRIFDIYQKCRTQEEIDAAFQKLRESLDEKIKTKMEDTRRILLDHFDEDVHARLRVNLAGTRKQLDRMGKMFWNLTKYILEGQAAFNDRSLTFDLDSSPLAGISPGNFHLIAKDRQNVTGEFLYRLSHPLGEYVIQSGKESHVPTAGVNFQISDHYTKISIIENLKNQSGWLVLQRLIIESFDHEEYLLFSAFDDKGSSLDQETCVKMFSCDGNVRSDINVP